MGCQQALADRIAKIVLQKFSEVRKNFHPSNNFSEALNIDRLLLHHAVRRPLKTWYVLKI